MGDEGQKRIGGRAIAPVDHRDVEWAGLLVEDAEVLSGAGAGRRAGGVCGAAPIADDEAARLDDFSAQDQ